MENIVLKQYLPLKLMKRRGMRMWQCCDSKTGYIYNFYTYSGKELANIDGIRGELVKKLTESIRGSKVSLCSDRFFTSINFLNTLTYPAEGTY